MNDLNGKTVLVTGATGFIGAHLVERLSGNKAIKLIVLSRRPYDTKGLGNISTVTASLDELSRGAWRQAGISTIDVVFHLAAHTPKSSSDSDNPNLIHRDNVVGTHALLESLPLPPQRIVFASTLDVYGATPNMGSIDETTPVNPAALYGASKYYGECLVQTYARKTGCGYAVLRFGHIFGPGEEAYNKLVTLAIRNVLVGKSPIVFGTGSAERDLLYVDDAVEAVIRAASLPSREVGPVNIVRGTSMPIRRIVELILKLADSGQTIDFLVDKPDGYSLRFDNRLMRELLGTWEYVSYEEGLKQEIASYREYLQRMEHYG